ncbi:MAG TPA: Gfo/Idh/MocA family oxidoreductase [Phycisphaerae bacterium]|nr:Gfo/Idh/MocA family oxidoreductase [Phycisphaerae bacterium]HRY71235.1 Gfo/Idh/MocA family oxidoreductase [Phycisphaerae bacterium]HSA29619.1 Gfo/Idh/MocA family oxidoreductase [Phycisphaerae bacterium]
MPRGCSEVSRRDFVKTAAAAVSAASAFPYFARARGADRPLKVGLIGSGRRGTTAALNAIQADPNVRIVALADVFQDRLDTSRNTLAKKGQQQIDDRNCFVGFDAYQKVLATDVDYVILATPPYYRPEHFEAAVQAGKHIFTEKPIAVDPVGVRRFMAAGTLAGEKGLCVVAGTHRRHQDGYVQTIRRIHDGAIGDILSAQCYFNQGQLWYKQRQAGWNDLEWMIRDWVNWTWLSGDHVVEQHMHNVDVINWVLGRHALKVVAMGGRARRVTGDQYDYFSADLFYPLDEKDREGRLHVLSQCRQVNGCATEISERVIGTQGVSNCNGWISNLSDHKPSTVKPQFAYVQEHQDLIAAIRGEKPLNESQHVAESTLTNIMIRMSAYTGAEVTWHQVMKSDLQLRQPDYALTPENIRAHIPVPGKA